MIDGAATASPTAAETAVPLGLGEQVRATSGGLFGGTVGTAALNLLKIALGFGATVTLTRILGAGGYGAYAFVLAWAMILSTPAAMAVTPLIIRNVAVYRDRAMWGLLRGVLRRTSQVVAVASGVVAALAAVMVYLFADHDSDLLAPFWVGMLLVPVLSLVALRQAAMQGLGRVVTGRLPETVVDPGLFLAFLAAAALLTGSDLSPSSALALQLSASVVAFVFGAWLLYRALPRGVRATRPEYDSSGWSASGRMLLAISVVMALNAQLGVVVVGALEGGTEAGIFAAAARAALFVGFLQAALLVPMMPAVARLQAASQTAELQRMLTRATRAVTLASVPGAIVFLVFAPQLLSVFGAGFDAGSVSLRILVVGELLKILTGFGATALVMSGHERALGIWAAGGVALNLLACATLVPSLGAEGAAIGAVLSVALSNVAFVVVAHRRLGVWAAPVGGPRRRT